MESSEKLNLESEQSQETNIGNVGVDKVIDSGTEIFKENVLEKTEITREDSWKPTTELGRLVKERKITSIEEVFLGRYNIMEAEIVNILLPDLEEDLLLIGQAKGKF